MSIQIPIFATPEQVREYIDTNHGSFVVSNDFAESNYYIQETPESSTVILINKINQFYYVFTRVLTKTTGSGHFVTSAERNTITQNKKLFLTSYSEIKHIGSDTDIKNHFRRIEEQRSQTREQARLQAQDRLQAQGGGGHMLDYIHYRETRAVIPIPISNIQLTSQPAHQVQTEEIKEDQNYKINITCPICLGNKVNMVCIPCGHCICSACQEQNPKKNECAICRKPIKTTQVFFL